jgi:hypothetical protein
MHKNGDLQVNSQRNGLLVAMKYASDEWQVIRKGEVPTLM